MRELKALFFALAALVVVWLILSWVLPESTLTAILAMAGAIVSCLWVYRRNARSEM